MNDLLKVLGGIVLALLGALFYLVRKNDNLSVEVDNLETKEKVIDLSAKIEQNKLKSQIEEARLALEKEEAERRKNDPVKPEDFN